MPLRHEREKIKRFKRILLTYLIQNWKMGSNPSLRQVISHLNLENKQMLITELRHLRHICILDGSYDMQGVYRLYPFKKYKQITSDVILKTYYEEDINL